MPVAGLDLARRSDHSALVLLDVEPDRLNVSAALRLPRAPLRQQFALIAPQPAGLDPPLRWRRGAKRRGEAGDHALSLWRAIPSGSQDLELRGYADVVSC